LTFDDVKNHIASHYSDKFVTIETHLEPRYQVKPADLLEACRILHDDDNLRFDFLNSLAAVDTGEQFEVFYSLSSVSHSTRLDFKVTLDRSNPVVTSVQSIWPSANWYERELWELYGIKVSQHDDLGTFLLPEDWDLGFPMRKDWQGPDDFVKLPEMES